MPVLCVVTVSYGNQKQDKFQFPLYKIKKWKFYVLKLQLPLC